MLGITDPSRKQSSPRKFIYEPECPGRSYYAALEKDFNDSAARGDSRSAPFNRQREDFIREISPALTSELPVTVATSPFMATQIARVNGRLHVFMANFKGLKAAEVAEQTPEKDIRITFSAKRDSKVFMLPFLGNVQDIRCNAKNGRATCLIPEIKKGAVVWIERHAEVGKNRGE